MYSILWYPNKTREKCRNSKQIVAVVEFCVWTERREWKAATVGNKKPEAKLFNTILTPKLCRFEFIMPECIYAKLDHSENSKLVNNDCIVRFLWNNSEVFHCSKSLGNILNRTVRTFLSFHFCQIQNKSLLLIGSFCYDSIECTISMVHSSHFFLHLI